MNAVIFLKSDRRVIGVVDGVKEVTGSDVTGQNGDTVRGIDLTIAEIIVTDNSADAWHIVPDDIADERDKLPETIQASTQRQIDELTLSLADIYASGGAI